MESEAAFVRDPGLLPYRDALVHRYSQYLETRKRIEADSGSLLSFAEGYSRFGLNLDGDSEWIFCEYLPQNITAAFLIGEFNGWSRSSHPLTGGKDGCWSIRLPRTSLTMGSKYKLHVVNRDGRGKDRMPAWTRRAEQNSETNLFDAVVVEAAPLLRVQPQHRLEEDSSPLIYECHVGMAGEEGRVHSFCEFRDFVLPRAKELGYTVVQLMAIQEHAYYGSFGYHVTSYFAASSRFGTEEDLRGLLAEAHRLGLRVIMDLVHSHASSNCDDGIAWEGELGYTFALSEQKHPAWDSALFDYGNFETLRFLLSNVRFWLELGFDGFRFDGVTSMLFRHHGVGRAFSGDYGEYFGENVNADAVVYLMLANQVVRASTSVDGLSVAEEVSGWPLLCRPVSEGGLGFSHRLGMAIPDVWIEYLKHIPDEAWDIKRLVATLTNRRVGEKVIAYAESHDQALVGDKTLMMWLLDARIYTDMSAKSMSVAADRAVALHKLIRLFTLSLGGQGWLGFFGNEFGHPEWLDFPRQGNNWSFHFCRRQWSLVNGPNADTLRFKALQHWETAMLKTLVARHPLLLRDQGESEFILQVHDKIVVFEKAGLLFLFSWHPSEPVVHHPVFTHFNRGTLRLVLASDDVLFGGFGRIAPHDLEIDMRGGQEGMGLVHVYLPPRVALVYEWIRE